MQTQIYLFSLIMIIMVYSPSARAAFVVERWGKIYIEDQKGELWDVSQAKSIGFSPRLFQYGMGRNAFSPLDDSHLKVKIGSFFSDPKIIGVVEGGDAQAFSIMKLSQHEVANTIIDNKAVSTAYWPLIKLAVVYNRTIDGKIITLAPSGWTYNNTFVLYDKESGTLWYPYEKGLMGIQGRYFKRILKKRPYELTNWQKWKKQYPLSKIIE